MRKLRRLAIAFGAAAALSIACGSTKNQGSLVLALETDVAVPENVDGIGIAVSVNNQIKYSQLFSIDITREQQHKQRVVKLPATIAVLESETGAPAVQVRAVAFWKGQARIVRDIISTVPHGRTALLRVPLAYLGYKDGVTGSIDTIFPSLPDQAATAHAGVIHLSDTTPGTGAATDIVEKISSRCALMNMTNVDGACVDPTIDSATLPDYVEKDLFENGITSEGFSNPEPCFDVGTCFAPSATSMQDLDRSNGECKVKLVGSAADLNVAMLLDTASATANVGFRVENLGNVIPMSRDDVHGFRPDEAAGVVHLPKGVCDRATVIKMVLAHRSECAQKTVLLPIDGAGANCLTVNGDAGTDAGDGADNADANDVPPPWWTPFNGSTNAAAITVTSDGKKVFVTTRSKDLYYVALDAKTDGSNQLEGPDTVKMPALLPSTLAFVATDDEYVYTTFGTSDAIAWTFAFGGPPYLTFSSNLSSATSGIITKVDMVMNPVTHCMGTGITGTCFPAPNRLTDNFPYMPFPGSMVSDQQSDSTPTVAGAYAISALGMEAYGAFNAPFNTGGKLAVGKVGLTNFTTNPGMTAYAITAVKDPMSGLVTSALTISSGGGMVHLAWTNPSTMALIESTNGPNIGPNDQTSYMHNLARDAAGYVYFTDNGGDLWSWNALLPTDAPTKMDATKRVGSFGVAVDDVNKVVYRAFTGDATTSGGVTRTPFPHP